MIDFRLEIARYRKINSLAEIITAEFRNSYSFSDPEIEFLAWGDPIPGNEFKAKLKLKPDVEFITQNLYGHYYFILLNKTGNILIAGSSLFSILPVYYREKESSILISNSPLKISDSLSVENINKRFILENILFNYPLFNQSALNDVLLVPSNHSLLIKQGNLYLHRHFGIEDYFSSFPWPWKKSAERVASKFIETSARYFPVQPFLASLTGGFDGRTILSCALKEGKPVRTYCFGTNKSSDILIAEKLSEKSGIPFHKINLDENYTDNFSLQSGLDFIRNANGSASFSRAHYLYSAIELSKITGIIVSGNFGSEVLRAPHEHGVVIGENLLNLFRSENYDKGLKNLQNALEWEWLNRSSFKYEFESLAEDIRKLPCFSEGLKELTLNQKFYKLIFEEVFRKYFGAEITNQFKFLVNRTPFLDIDFLRELLLSGLAGANSDFLSANPLKRFKGQYLYAKTISMSYPVLGSEITDKGYSPSDLLNPLGNMSLGLAYIGKRVKKNKITEPDPFSVDTAFAGNRNFWLQHKIDSELFNAGSVRNGINSPGSTRDSLFIALSQSYFSRHICNDFNIN